VKRAYVKSDQDMGVLTYRHEIERTMIEREISGRSRIIDSNAPKINQEVDDIYHRTNGFIVKLRTSPLTFSLFEYDLHLSISLISTCPSSD
jgi:hypothetical protein